MLTKLKLPDQVSPQIWNQVEIQVCWRGRHQLSAQVYTQSWAQGGGQVLLQLRGTISEDIDVN